MHSICSKAKQQVTGIVDNKLSPIEGIDCELMHRKIKSFLEWRLRD